MVTPLFVLVAFIIIVAALGTVVAVMVAVMREKHEHEEWYIPPPEADVPAVDAPVNPPPVASAETA